MNLSSTPCTNLESYILCLHCTSRRVDLKEKERNGFRGISQFTVYCYYSHFSFISVLNTVPPPALNPLPNLQPPWSTSRKSHKHIAERERLDPCRVSLGPRLREVTGDRPHRAPPGSAGPTSPRSGLHRAAALAHPQPPPRLQRPPVGPVTLPHPSSRRPRSQSAAAAHVL